MRLAAACLALVLLAGCEKSFDERYEDAEKDLREKAAELDEELAEQAPAAEAADEEEAARD